MRKRLKKKKHSCALCKPHKTGWANRWKSKDFALLKEFDPAPFRHNNNPMYWLYIIKSRKNGELYIGSTSHLVRRLEEHNSGNSSATSRYKPWFYVYVEGYFSEEDARYRERSLKYFGKVYAQLKKRIKNSLQGAEKVRG